VADPLLSSEAPRRIGPNPHRNVNIVCQAKKTKTSYCFSEFLTALRALINRQNVFPGSGLGEVPFSQSSSKPTHDGPPVGDLRARDRVGGGVHARNTGPIFQEDNIAVIKGLALCALDGQQILGGEDREGEKNGRYRIVCMGVESFLLL